jgi:hypothetical protein
MLRAALWVIEEGIETIGGGWSYGCGRLKVEQLRWANIELKKRDQRSWLWKQEMPPWVQSGTWRQIEEPAPEIAKPWVAIEAGAGLLDGQLLAISTRMPPEDLDSVVVGAGGKLPDRFVYRQSRIGNNGSSTQEFVVTGKALRQAIFSTAIERALRTRNETVCNGEVLAAKQKKCSCKMCSWFGNTFRRGMISVADSRIAAADATVINRIQLCEHSLQNMNLFSEEYLTGGRFDVKILIDLGDTDQKIGVELFRRVLLILEQMQESSNSCPPGWYRIGGSATAAGQLTLDAAIIKAVFRPQTVGGDYEWTSI